MNDPVVEGINDPIVEAIHRYREAYAARFNCDPKAMFADIKQREEESKRNGWVFVSYPPQLIEQEGDEAPAGSSLSEGDNDPFSTSIIFAGDGPARIGKDVPEWAYSVVEDATEEEEVLGIATGKDYTGDVAKTS